MKLEFSLIVLCLSMLLSCKKKADKLTYHGNIPYISQDSLVEGLGGIVDSVKYIQLETTKDCLLTRVRKLEMYDGKIFVRDIYDDLYVFAENGQFLSRIGQKGRGEEEFATMTDFCLDKTNHWVGILDAIGKKMIYYDFEGKFVKSVLTEDKNLPYLLASVRHKDALLNFYLCFIQNIYYLQLYGVDNMELKASVHPFFRINCTSSSNFIGFMHPYAETSQGITFLRPCSDTIFQYDGTTIKPYFVLGHDLPLASQSICAGFNPAMDDKYFNDFLVYLADNQFFQSILKIYETKDHLLLVIESDKYVTLHIVWDKKRHKGRYEGIMSVNLRENIYRPFIHHLISSMDDCFIGVYHDNDLDNFDDCVQRGYRIDAEMQKIMESREEDANPVVALFYMKKEI